MPESPPPATGHPRLVPAVPSRRSLARRRKSRDCGTKTARTGNLFSANGAAFKPVRHRTDSLWRTWCSAPGLWKSERIQPRECGAIHFGQQFESPPPIESRFQRLIIRFQVRACPIFSQRARASCALRSHIKDREGCASDLRLQPSLLATAHPTWR